MLRAFSDSEIDVKEGIMDMETVYLSNDKDMISVLRDLYIHTSFF